MYERKIQQMQLKRCKILTLWLKAEDYPKLLGFFFLLLSSSFSLLWVWWDVREGEGGGR